MRLDNLKTNQGSYYNLLNSAFEADFLWKVGLKILNSGLILKTFTHELHKPAKVKRACSTHAVSCEPLLFANTIERNVTSGDKDTHHFFSVIMIMAIMTLLLVIRQGQADDYKEQSSIPEQDNYISCKVRVFRGCFG